jgi:hypothetical protein
MPNEGSRVSRGNGDSALGGLFVSETATVRFWTGHGYVPEYSSGYLAEGQVSIPWPAANLAVSVVLRNYAFRGTLTPWVFLVSGLIALLMAAVTVSIHALQAVKANPSDTLKYE